MFWYLTPKYKRLAKDHMCEKNFNMKDKEQKKQKWTVKKKTRQEAKVF